MSVDPKLTQRWVTYPQSATVALPQYFSFNAPIGATASAQCGQMVFTDLHIPAVDNQRETALRTADLPATYCKAPSLSPQEKALIFMLFDLTNCLTPIVG